MGGKSDWLENKVLDHYLGSQASGFVGTVFIALYTGTGPGDAGGGTEVAGTSYSRLAVANTSANWPAASGGTKSSGADFTFVTASESWGTVSAFGLFGSATSGNLLYWGTLTTSKAVDSGEAAKFASGSITITEE